MSTVTATTAPATPNAFVSFLDKAGELFKEGVEKALPFLKGATEVAEAAEPIIDLALPMEGPLFNTCVAAAISAQQQGAAAAANGTGLTGAQKLANVTAVVGPILTQQLAQNGVTGPAATTAMTSYLNAIVALLKGPLAQQLTAAVAPTATPAPTPAV